MYIGRTLTFSELHNQIIKIYTNNYSIHKIVLTIVKAHHRRRVSRAQRNHESHIELILDTGKRFAIYNVSTLISTYQRLTKAV